MAWARVTNHKHIPVPGDKQVFAVLLCRTYIGGIARSGISAGGMSRRIWSTTTTTNVGIGEKKLAGSFWRHRRGFYSRPVNLNFTVKNPR